MSELRVRRVRFDLAGDDIPFNWHPRRSSFAMQCNVVSFFAPGFEKFIFDATREAIPMITDPAAAEEAQLYLRQEAQHSAAHLAHIRALSRRWPGLQQVADDVVASYERLTATRSLRWRLAYPAVLEATFTPYFKVFLDHDDTLFEPGDDRVASLFLWHFAEEIEHRSSALLVYNAVADDYLFRLRTIPAVVRHLHEILTIIGTGFREHVPADEGGAAARLMPSGLGVRALFDTIRAARAMRPATLPTYAGVPRRELAAMIAGLIRSQGPGHDPRFENLPPLAARWFDRYDEDPRVAPRWYRSGAGRTA